MKNTNEAAFETVIETHLLENGFVSFAKESFDHEGAIAGNTGEQILTDLCKSLYANGCLSTLRARLTAAAVTGQIDMGGDP